MGTLDRESSMKEADVKAKEASKEARDEAARIAESAKEKSKSILEEQKSSAAESVSSVAMALRQTADQLDRQHQGAMANIAVSAADALDRWSHTLRERDVDSMLNQVTDYARRQPAVFIGGALAAGFLLSRFLKSRAKPEAYEYGGEGYYGYEEERHEGPMGTELRPEESPKVPSREAGTAAEIKGDLI